jgi:hypothetical protein
MTKSILDRTCIPLTKVELTKMKVKAIRRGFWFKVLSRTERASIDLTIKVVERVRSLILARVLGAIIRKLLDAMESKVACVMKEVGHGLAEKLSRIAQNWGNKSAHHWKEDPNFVQYLAVTYINTPAMFKA